MRSKVCGTSTGTGGAAGTGGSGGSGGIAGPGGSGGGGAGGSVDAGGRGGVTGAGGIVPPPPFGTGGSGGTGRGGSGGSSGGTGGTSAPATWPGTPAACPAATAPATIFTEGFESYPSNADLYGASGSPWIAVEPNGLVQVDMAYPHTGRQDVSLWDFGDPGTHYAPLPLTNRPALLSVEFWYYADSFFPEHTYASVGVGYASSKFSLTKLAQVRGAERSLLYSSKLSTQETTVFEELELGRQSYMRLDFDFCQAKVLIYAGTDATAPMRASLDFPTDLPINALFIAGAGNLTYLDDFKVTVSPAPADSPPPDRG
jgi:hypothetical protein